MRRCLQLLLLSLVLAIELHADDQAFDLSGPKVDVHVKRGDVTLPISETPNLLPGDRLWIHPDLPATQSAHFVLVVVFLRGSTNPPPPEWFTRVETWNPRVHEEGVFVIVPAEAQQALLFLAPETGGDFNTLRNAVRGRPGAFIRAMQDLQVAGWDRMRLDAYLAEMKDAPQTDAKALKDLTELTARSLGIKVDKECFDKPTEQQAPCLTQNSGGMVLDDANAQSLVAQIASGSTTDLMNQISASPLAGGGLYSPYVGAIVDTARILSSLHTAHFQYIPALALPVADTLNLRLNVPPSFRNPKSVVMVALPPIGPVKPQPLHAVNPAEILCAQNPSLVLPAEGAPLFFATQLARNLTLRIRSQAGGPSTSMNLALKPDATKGGLVIVDPVPSLPTGDLTAVVHGKWGFDDWEGPHYRLRTGESGKWTLASSDRSALVVGREDTLHLDGGCTVCVDKVEEQADGGQPLKLTWKSTNPESLELKLAMKDAQPGPVTVSVYEFGLSKPDRLVIQAYDAAASLDRLSLNAGDMHALLKGTRLDEVAHAKLEGIQLNPAQLTHVENLDQLTMNADESTSSLVPGRSYAAEVELRDGRRLKAPVMVSPPRPQVILLNKGLQTDSGAPPSPVQLGNADDLPVQSRLVFFLKSVSPETFPRDEKVEVAAADRSFSTVLDLNGNGLMLEDARTAVATVEPQARFGASAFGPVRLRVLAGDGSAGDWLPLGTLVRMPGFNDLRCPRAVAKPCILTGSNLFLAASIAPTPDFQLPTEVPRDFTGTQLAVPHPVNGTLYLKLRDDPATVQTLTLPVTQVSLAAAQAAAAQSQTPSAPQASAQPPSEAPVAPQPAPQAQSEPPATSQSQGPPPAKTGP